MYKQISDQKQTCALQFHIASPDYQRNLILKYTHLTTHHEILGGHHLNVIAVSKRNFTSSASLNRGLPIRLL
jgi:hypothetical protein